MKYDLNAAAHTFGAWFTARMQEYKGEGKNRRPKWDPDALLGTRKKPERTSMKRAREFASMFGKMPGVGVTHNKRTPSA